MNFPPRLRHSCQPTKRGTDQGRRIPPSIDLTLPDADEEANLALLSGMIAEEPIQDKDRDGGPVTVLLLAFDAPDEKAHAATACCEVEVPEEIADPQRAQLRAGRRLVVLGRLTGAGGLWATAIVTRG